MSGEDTQAVVIMPRKFTKSEAAGLFLALLALVGFLLGQRQISKENMTRSLKNEAAVESLKNKTNAISTSLARMEEQLKGFSEVQKRMVTKLDSIGDKVGEISDRLSRLERN